MMAPEAAPSKYLFPISLCSPLISGWSINPGLTIKYRLLNQIDDLERIVKTDKRLWDYNPEYPQFEPQPKPRGLRTLVIAATLRQYEIVLEQEELEPLLTRRVSEPQDLRGRLGEGIIIFQAVPWLGTQPFVIEAIVNEILVRGFRIHAVRT